MTEFRVFGGLTASQDGLPRELGTSKAQCLLAVLLAEANTVVPTDVLVDRAWGEDGPRQVRSSLHSYLSRLRRVLGDSAGIEFRSTGYRLTVDPDRIDLHRFRALVAGAAREPIERIALARYEDALRLADATPFAGLDTPWFRLTRATVEAERESAELAHADLALRVGRHTELLPALTERSRRRPLDERLAGQLMRALFGSGRQAEALDCFERVRVRLREDLGLDPGPELRGLHEQILRADRALSARPTASTPVPRQLPPPPASFIGRAEEIENLDALLDTTGTEGATVAISAIGGTGGVGKTWLALHWAYRNLGRFPDGQLFTDLHGFDSTDEPTAPPTVLRGFLHALGVEPSRIPADPSAQAGLYRGLVADKRLLIVLDNAADAGQVVPLLPSGSACTVLFTSRDRLSSVVTAHGATPLALDVLDDEASRTLLAARLGPERLDREPEAVAELVRDCAGLPLALSIVVGRALETPNLPLSALAAELRDATTRLTVLDEGPTSSVTAVLSWSFAALREPNQRLFALLGLVPGPDFGRATAAALADLDETRVGALLRALERASLLHRTAPGRYRMHDLIRLYAAEQANTRLRAEEREAALHRLVDFFVHTAFTSDRLLSTRRALMTLDPPAQGARPYTPPDEAAALAWFDAEHAGLLAVQQLAATLGWHRQVWLLAQDLTAFHYRRGHLRDDLTSWETALAAAEGIADPAARIMALRLLGYACSVADRQEEAIRHLSDALALAERDGSTLDRGHIHYTLSGVRREGSGDAQRGIEHARLALDCYREAGDPMWISRGLNVLGHAYAEVGDYDRAREQSEAALAMHHANGDRNGAAAALDSLASIAALRHAPAEAADYYGQAVDLLRELGNVYREADVHVGLGAALADLGRTEEAESHWRRALAMYQAQNRDDEAANVHKRLSR